MRGKSLCPSTSSRCVLTQTSKSQTYREEQGLVTGAVWLTVSSKSQLVKNKKLHLFRVNNVGKKKRKLNWIFTDRSAFIVEIQLDISTTYSFPFPLAFQILSHTDLLFLCARVSLQAEQMRTTCCSFVGLAWICIEPPHETADQSIRLSGSGRRLNIWLGLVAAAEQTQTKGTTMNRPCFFLFCVFNLISLVFSFYLPFIPHVFFFLFFCHLSDAFNVPVFFLALKSSGHSGLRPTPLLCHGNIHTQA